MMDESVAPSNTPPCNAVYDGNNYYYLPWSREKPCVCVESYWENIAFRLEPLNALLNIIDRLVSNPAQRRTMHHFSVTSSYTNLSQSGMWKDCCFIHQHACTILSSDVTFYGCIWLGRRMPNNEFVSEEENSPRRHRNQRDESVKEITGYNFINRARKHEKLAGIFENGVSTLQELMLSVL